MKTASLYCFDVLCDFDFCGGVIGGRGRVGEWGGVGWDEGNPGWVFDFFLIILIIITIIILRKQRIFVSVNCESKFYKM